MIIFTLVYGAIIGSISGLLWGFVFSASSSLSVKVGAFIGLVIGLFFAMFGKSASVGGNLKHNEAMFVNSSIMTALFVIVGGAGLVTWLIKLIFF